MEAWESHLLDDVEASDQLLVSPEGKMAVVSAIADNGFTSAWVTYFDGESWHDPELAETESGHVLDVAGAISAEGDVLIAWVQEDEAGHHHLFLRERLSDHSWGDVVEFPVMGLISSLTGGPVVGGHISVAYAGDGSTYLAWPSGDLFVTRRDSNASAWTSPENLGQTQGPGPTIVSNSSGGVGILAEGPCVTARTSGGSWSQHHCLTGGMYSGNINPKHRHLWIDDNGDITLAWLTRERSSKPASVMVSYSNVDDFEWSDPEDVDADDFGPADQLAATRLTGSDAALTWVQTSGFDTTRWARAYVGGEWLDPIELLPNAPDELTRKSPPTSWWVAPVPGHGFGVSWITSSGRSAPFVWYAAIDGVAGTFAAPELVWSPPEGDPMPTYLRDREQAMTSSGLEHVAIQMGRRVSYR